jgi:hypothetical protein
MPKFTTKLESDPKTILGYLHLGTSLPVIPEYHKYILGDLEEYNAKAIFLEEAIDKDYFGRKTDRTVGMTLVYGDGSDTLYFGFFNVLDHSSEKIQVLLQAMVEYAQKEGFTEIRGPINVPTMIFGWGFMVEGSKKDLFIGSPINPPIYQETFLTYGFEVLFQEDRYDMPALKMDPHKNKKLIEMGINEGDYKADPFDTGEYPYQFYNLSKEEMMECKEEYVELYDEFMPPSAQITPKSSHNFDNLVNFIYEFGSEWMMWIVREKATEKMVANGYVIPDPYHRNRKGELNSISFHAWVVRPEHRRNYLAMIMYGFTSLRGKDRKTPHYITRGSWPVGAENIPNGKAAIKMGGKKDRSHLILQYSL